MTKLPLAILLFLLPCHGCVVTADYGRSAINFVTFLVIRDYSSAYALTSTVYRQRYSMDDLRAEFELAFPRADGSFDPVSVQAGFSDWPGKPSPDLTWIYVRIGGRTQRTIGVLVMMENGDPRVKEVAI